MLQPVIIFIIFLCPLIFFHELGHFLFARFFGVRVETFSIGFGPKLFRFARGGTEYFFSLIPFGGYVKMFGDDPYGEEKISEEEKAYAFNYKSKWARFWIVFGGPFANFILAYLLFFAILLTGQKVPEPKIGVLPKESLLRKIGLKSGDVLTSINGTKIVGASEIEEISGDLFKNVTVERDVNETSLSVSISKEVFLKEYFAAPPSFMRPIFVDVRGNRFMAFRNESQVKSSISLLELIRTPTKKMVLFNIKAGLEEDISNITSNDIVVSSKKIINFNKLYSGENLLKKLQDGGFFAYGLKIKSVVDETPASEMGMAKGDIVVTLNKKRVYRFEDLKKSLQKMKEGENAELSFYRNTLLKVIKVVPSVIKENDKTVFRLGIVSSGVPLEFKFVDTEGKGFLESFGLAFQRTYLSFGKILSGLKQLVFSEVSFKQVGGPILIGEVASKSFDIGLSHFFNIMAIISVNLGIINLIPIPVLDGGHIMFLFFELVNKGRLSRKKVEYAQQFGVFILLILVFATIYNDLLRLLRF
ncbi:RIP metalloprotease RseP [Bacteriovoracaceae bacterium]|nr:RIP metalloprotease RseP [Bacteriovoracaceae bacterium]